MKLTELCKEVLRKYPEARDNFLLAYILFCLEFKTEEFLRMCKSVYEVAIKRGRVKVKVEKANLDGVEVNVKKYVPNLKREDAKVLLEGVKGLPNPEIVIREFRRIQNEEGLFRPSEKVAKMRRRAEEIMKDRYSKRVEVEF